MIGKGLFERFIEMVKKYKENNVFICKNAIIDFIVVICLVAGIAIYFILIEQILFALILLISIPIFVFARLSTPRLIRLEEKNLLIKYYNKELKFDIDNINIRYEILTGRGKHENLHITTIDERNCYKIFINNQVREDIIILVHLINYLKNSEMQKIEDLTYDSYLEIKDISTNKG